MAAPNQYHLHGGGISVSFYPDGSGPGIVGRGLLLLVYQDAQQSLTFYENDVRSVEVPDLGKIVSVTVVMTVDTGRTTFSLLVPDVQLPEDQNSISIDTDGITTIHRAFAAMIGHPQSETYTVTPLHGTAAGWALAL
jgi:hypothetical protein